MPQIAAGLSPTQSGISTYVGRTATPNQQATITTGVTGLPSDTFGGITASSDGAGTYYSDPVASWVNSVTPGKYVYMIGLRGDGTGNMVYARIEIQAKMRFRQTCYRYWQQQTWSATTASPSKWWKVASRTAGKYEYYTIRDYSASYPARYQILEMPTTLFWAENINYQIMTVTNNNYSSPGYLFSNYTVSPSANLKVSSRTYALAEFNPFGTYTFKTSLITGNTSAGTNYTLYGPNNAPVVSWDETDGSYPWNENSNQVFVGVASDVGGYSATIDDFTVRDI